MAMHKVSVKRENGMQEKLGGPIFKPGPVFLKILFWVGLIF